MFLVDVPSDSELIIRIDPEIGDGKELLYLWNTKIYVVIVLL